MVALIFAVVAAVTVPAVSIVATIVIIAVAIFKCLATLFTPVISLTSVVAAVAVVEMTFAYRAAPVVVIAVRGLRAGSARKNKKPTQRGGGQRCLTEQRLPETMQLHTSSLGAFTCAGWGCLRPTYRTRRQSKCRGAQLRIKPDCVEHYGTILGGTLGEWARRRNRAKRKEAQCLRHRASSHIEDCGSYWG